jgi:hypothetical protein
MTRGQKRNIHRMKLTELYKNQLGESGEFMGLVLKEAIRKLNVGVPPKKVEDWVVSLEKSWMNI